ncbi:MAG: VOC family protein [Propionibacteriaceae bacterium]|nr:VOC family protein [Propionibacteriaceae bacterium]
MAFYRDLLGWEEAWREGGDTVAFHIPDSAVQVMVSVSDDPPGAMYRVGDLVAFLAENPDLDVFSPPTGIPGGQVAGVRDAGGNEVYFFDFTDG